MTQPIFVDVLLLGDQLSQIALAVTCGTDQGLHIYYRGQDRELLERLKRADCVIGWNYGDLIGKLPQPLCDLAEVISIAAERAVSLEEALMATFGQGASVPSEKAVLELWNEGLVQELVRACKHRVKAIMLLHLYIGVLGKIQVKGKDGKIHPVGIPEKYRHLFALPDEE